MHYTKKDYENILNEVTRRINNTKLWRDIREFLIHLKKHNIKNPKVIYWLCKSYTWVELLSVTYEWQIQELNELMALAKSRMD